MIVKQSSKITSSTLLYHYIPHYILIHKYTVFIFPSEVAQEISVQTLYITLQSLKSQRIYAQILLRLKYQSPTNS